VRHGYGHQRRSHLGHASCLAFFNECYCRDRFSPPQYSLTNLGRCGLHRTVSLSCRGRARPRRQTCQVPQLANFNGKHSRLHGYGKPQGSACDSAADDSAAFHTDSLVSRHAYAGCRHLPLFFAHRFIPCANTTPGRGVRSRRCVRTLLLVVGLSSAGCGGRYGHRASSDPRHAARHIHNYSTTAANPQTRTSRCNCSRFN